jgi:DNA processing protein
VDRDELAAWLRLGATEGVGAGAARRLLATFGLPQAIFAQDAQALGHVATDAQVRALTREPAGFAELLDRTWDWLQASPSHHVLTLADAAYPASLLETADPPVMLYGCGHLPQPWPRAIAVVGSRNPTAQGLQNAREFSRAFAKAGLTVVSGLALGVDGAAHEGALEGAARDMLATIAVVGTGLDRVYPAKHGPLAHRIAERGLLLSEYPLGTPPLAENFPRRNRILSALASGTLVVEAAVQSGSLITARLAAEQGREVFAIPGSIHAPQSRGCHALIKQGAKLVETSNDVLEELGAPAAAARAAASPAADTPLLQALGFDPVGIDALVARTGVAPSVLQAQLLELELEGQIARLAGGLFQRVVRG